jgi:tetratricopeptide (TPR) repeat protein
MLGCGTSTLKVDTNPSGANVFATTVGANDRHLIGKTPLPRTLTKDIQKGQMGALMLDIELERYQNTSILIAENGNSESEISLQLKSIPVEKKVESDKKDESEKKDETAKKAELDPVQVNKNLDQLFEAQRLARIGRFEDSLKLLDEVGKVFPKWASVSEMRGGIFLLQKKYGNALDEYQKSLSLNSENTNILAIIKNLEKRMGAKSAEKQTTNSLTDPKSKQ